MDAALVRTIVEGGAVAILIVVLFGVSKFAVLLFNFFTARMNAQGVFTEAIANQALDALKATQQIAADSARAQQAMTDAFGVLCAKNAEENKATIDKIEQSGQDVREAIEKDGALTRDKVNKDGEVTRDRVHQNGEATRKEIQGLRSPLKKGAAS